MTALFLTPVAMAGEQSPVARVAMKDLFAAERGSAQQTSEPLAGITVTLEAARQQVASDQGLRLDVSIRNNAARTWIIEDPGDFIQIQLLDSKGYPVDLPPVTPRRFLCERSATTDHRTESKPQPFGIEALRPFELLRPAAPRADASRDKGAPSEPHLEAGRLVLPVGREYRLTLQVRKILADPAGYLASQEEQAKTRADSQAPPAAPPAAVPIPAGRYSARVQIVLVPPAGSGESRQLASDPVVVDLKPAPSPPNVRRE
jgi:hypothetical protein